MGERKQPNRWRCLTTGCNPPLHGEDQAGAHQAETGHRVAKWPVRSAEGQRRARKRTRSGYYDKYNVGDKALENRLGRPRRPGGTPLTGEDMSMDNAGPFGE